MDSKEFKIITELIEKIVVDDIQQFSELSITASNMKPEYLETVIRHHKYFSGLVKSFRGDPYRALIKLQPRITDERLKSELLKRIKEMEEII